MYLRHDHTYSAVELYKTFDLDKLKGKGKIARLYKCRDKKALAQKIFLRYLYLLLLDMINGDKIFYFPSKHLSCIRMAKVSGEKFKELRRKGFFKDVDFLKSDFSGYYLVMDYFTSTGKKLTKYIAVNKELRDIITAKTNQGYKYC